MVMRFRPLVQRPLALIPITLTAVALAACGHRYEAEPEYEVSIKDRPSASVFEPRQHFYYTAPSTRPVPMPRERLGAATVVPKPQRPVAKKVSADSGVTVVPKAAAAPLPAPSAIVRDVTPKMAKAAPAPAPAPAAEPPAPAAVPLPPANVPAPIVPKADVPAKSAAAPAVEVTPKVEVVPPPMAGTPAAAQKPVITPPAEVRPAAPKADAPKAEAPKAEPPKAEVAQPPAVVPPKVVAKAPEQPAPKATPPAPPASTKVTSLSEQTRVKDALDRADQFLKTGQATNARALLQDAARGENIDLLTALAATYDPLVLKDYPASASAADPKRAAELYEAAIAKGSVAAKDRLARLKETMSKP